MPKARVEVDKRLPALYICRRLRIRQCDIAELAGTNQTAVSRTLNGEARCVPVLKAVRQLVPRRDVTNAELFGPRHRDFAELIRFLAKSKDAA